MQPRPPTAEWHPHRALAAALAGLALALWATACGSSSAGPRDLVVTSHTPGDARTDLAEPIQIQFDRPVVKSSEVGIRLDHPPVAVSPPVAADAEWASRHTLVLTPTAELRPSTRYRIDLTGPLARRTGGFGFDFVNQPLEVDGVWGIAPDRLPPSPTLPLHFNQPVSASEVVGHCHLTAGEKRVALTTAVAARVDSSIDVSPAAPLPQGQAVELSCEGLRGAGGSARMTQAFSQALHTYPRFSVVSMSPDGSDVPADEVEVAIHFSTPVDLEAVRRHLTSTPRVTGLSRGTLDDGGTTYRAVVNLKVKTGYALRVTRGLTDTFGQALAGAPPPHRFTTGNARPRMSLETGIFAVEPTMPGYPVWTRSLGHYRVKCAAVPRARVVQLLTGDMNYDPWYDAQSPNQVGWTKLGLRPRARTVTITDPKNNWHLDRVDLPEVCHGPARGVYLADFSSPELQPNPDRPWMYRPDRRVLANITDLGVLLKAGPASGLVWVTRLSTGTPVAGAKVTLYSPQGKRVWGGTSDAHGLVHLPGATRLLRRASPDDRHGAGDDEDAEAMAEVEDWESYRSQRLIALVEKDGDLAAVDGNWENGIQVWNFGVSEDRKSGDTRIRGLIQSDRGIYRPGETVHFKGLVREIAIGRPPAVPSAAPAHIQVQDSRGATVLDKKVPLSRFGGFAFDLPLTPEAPTGDYRVLAVVKHQSFHETFQVEEFRKVEFEIGLKTPAPDRALGDRLDFDLSADYLFGAPVQGSKVSWQVQRRPHTLMYARFPQYSFADWAARGDEWWWYQPPSENLSFVSDGQGTTDARGRFRFAVRDPQTTFDGPQDYLVRATVTDDSDQTISRQVVVTAHPSAFYLGMHSEEFVQAVGMPFAVNTVAVRPDGTQTAARATLTYVKQTRTCKDEQIGVRYHASCTTVSQPVFTRDIAIPATGAGTERIMPKDPGTYVIRIESKDPKGVRVTASSYVWVLGKGEAFWSGDEDARMSLVASRAEYRPGETARLAMQASLPHPTALVTTERNGIMSARVVTLGSTSEGLEVPITQADAPNVFASVALVSGRTGPGDRHRPRFKMGVVDLKVSSEAQRLAVNITTDKDTYQPGQRVSGVVRLSQGGAPVVGEVALSVADEGVLKVIDYKTPDPMKAFYAVWGLGVDTGTNWNRVARLNDPEVADPDEGGDSGASGGDRIRSRFVSSAYWAPELVTDETGQVHFSFVAPDNLTAFRLMAVAADDGARFGSGERRITVAKPLLAKPVLPRFASAGDRVEVGVVVFNHTGRAGPATVTARTRGVALARGEKTVVIPDGGSARVRFRGRVRRVKEAHFEFAVTLGEDRDALSVAVPVEQQLAVDRATLAQGTLGGPGAPGSIAIPVAWAPGTLPSESRLDITVDRTGLAELEPSLRYLVEYPYGCLEQTLSRFIPLLKVKDLSRTLDLASLRGPRMEAFLRAGVAKVLRHQHADGNFSLWPTSQAMPHLTVYALYGLEMARKAGMAVDAQAEARGLAALKRWTSSGERVIGENSESGTLAMAAYVMAEMGQPDGGLDARLYEARRGLPRYGQGFLLMAMKLGKAPAGEIDTLTHEIVRALAAQGDSVIVHESLDMDEVMGSDLRSTAIMLQALLMVAPNHPLIDRLVKGLEDAQLPSGAWRNTQDNLFALIALADYARARTAGASRVVVKINGRRVAARTLRGGKPLVLSRPLSRLQQGAVTLETDAPARYAVRLTTAQIDPAATSENHGLRVAREYLDPTTGQPVTRPRVNQLIRVRLTVTNADEVRYVAVRDRLPAGLEPVNARLASEAGQAGAGVDAGAGGASRWYWSRPTWVHTDLRDDGAEVFADDLRPGAHVFEYTARAALPGRFVAGPAVAEAMYHPEVRGRTAAATVTVRRGR